MLMMTILTVTCLSLELYTRKFSLYSLIYENLPMFSRVLCEYHMCICIYRSKMTPRPDTRLFKVLTRLISNIISIKYNLINLISVGLRTEKSQHLVLLVM